MPRTIFIGDIHGCLDELESLIVRLAIEPADRVFCAGDFMDRGPSPAGCVQLARSAGFASVLGNHEEKHLRWRRHEQRRAADPSYKNPMRSLHPQSVADNAALTDEDIEYSTRETPWPTLQSMRDVDAESTLYQIPARKVPR